MLASNKIVDKQKMKPKQAESDFARDSIKAAARFGVAVTSKTSSTDRRSDQPTGRLSDRPTDKLTDRPTDKLTNSGVSPSRLPLENTERSNQAKPSTSSSGVELYHSSSSLLANRRRTLLVDRWIHRGSGFLFFSRKYRSNPLLSSAALKAQPCRLKMSLHGMAQQGRAEQSRKKKLTDNATKLHLEINALGESVRG